MRGLGADEFVDRRRFEDVVSGVDAVVDTVGGTIQDRSWEVLRTGGVLVSLDGVACPESAKARGVRGVSIPFRTSVAPALEVIGHLLDARRVKPLITEVFPLEQARRVHELAERAEIRGKIVLVVI